MEYTNDSTTIIGTVSGTTLSVVTMFDTEAIIKTIVFAAIGATISFSVTMLLKWVWKKLRKKRK